MQTLPLNRTDIIHLLDKQGILPTSQRLEIAELLFSAARHLSAEQIKVRLTEQGSTVSKATVYNTLGLFADKQIINRVVIDAERVLYDSNTQPHFHIFDQDSGELHDIAIDQIEISRLPELPSNQEIIGMDIVLHTRRK